MKPVVKHTVGALLCLALLGGRYLVLHRPQDRTPPEIQIEQEQLSLSVHDDPAVLLTGVTAVDKQDGDVTDLVVVEHMGTLSQDFTSSVTYAAFDHTGNVSKATRTVRYTDYTGMRFHLKAPLVFSTANIHSLIDQITVEDSLDGDLSDRIKPSLVGGDLSLNEVGHHEVQLRVTNSLGYTQRLTVPVEVYAPDTYNAAVELTENLVYLKQGDSFQPEAYPKWLTVSDQVQRPLSGPSSTARINIQSNVNTAAAGVYSVTYSVEDDAYRGCATLIVVVEE